MTFIETAPPSIPVTFIFEPNPCLEIPPDPKNWSDTDKLNFAAQLFGYESYEDFISNPDAVTAFIQAMDED
jgi:hypothetical protein